MNYDTIIKQIFLVHDKHPFDINNKEDIDVLDKWKAKCKEHKLYYNAIDIWTKRWRIKI